MAPLQIVVLLIFTLTTFGNVFLLQPGVEMPPVVHAAVVSADVSFFFLALNLKRFSELGSKAEISVPQAPMPTLRAPEVVAAPTFVDQTLRPPTPPILPVAPSA